MVQEIEHAPLLLTHTQQAVHVPKKTCSKKSLLLSSTILGVGVGLAMMPIFNEEVEHLENYGINVHGNSIFFAISTINTLIIVGISTGFYFFRYLNDSEKEEEIELNEIQKNALAFCKVCSFIASLMPVQMLWNIELNDHKIQETHGFDQFITWATFTSIPLICFKTLTNFEQVSQYIVGKSENTPLSSIGSKITVNGISAISLIGRGICLSNVFHDFQKNIGIEQNISIPIAVIAGGIIGNITLGLSEYSGLKKLFANNTDELNYKQILGGIISVLEGGWFSLPMISQGLNAIEGWNPLLTAAIFSPLFLSHVNSEATHLYNSIFSDSPTLEEDNNQVEPLGNS